MTVKRNLLIVVMTAAWCSLALGAEPSSSIRVYLPEGVRPQVATLDMGSISIIRCDDEKLLAKVSAVAMGRAPWTGEKMVIDRSTILSRLASNGITSEQVVFSGAEKIVVERDEWIIKSDQLLNVCEKFLQDTRPGPADCMWKLAKTLKDLPVPASKDMKILPALAKESPAGQIKIEITVTSGTANLGKTEAFFTIMYPAQQAVATKDIVPGEAISKDNSRIDIVPSETKPVDGWTAPYGMKAAGAIKAGTVLTSGTIQPPKPEILVKARQIVTMRLIIGDGFIITANGEAQQDGRAGDFIKVKNSDTKQMVIAKVAFDGTVEPMVGDSQK